MFRLVLWRSHRDGGDSGNGLPRMQRIEITLGNSGHDDLVARVKFKVFFWRHVRRMRAIKTHCHEKRRFLLGVLL